MRTILILKEKKNRKKFIKLYRNGRINWATKLYVMKYLVNVNDKKKACNMSLNCL